MAQLLIAMVILGLVIYGARFFAHAPPRLVARIVRSGAGGAVGIVSLVLLLRGRVDLGVLGFGVAGWLAGIARMPAMFSAWHPFKAASSSGRSSVRSARIAMELDHASGAMAGMIVGGPQDGRSLDTLTRTDCEQLYRDCLGDDPEGARLLEAYMDRRFAGWREARETQGNARADRDGRRDTGLSEQQAYEILGLREDATRDDVILAHRTLMKKIHPDHGGTTERAARVNEAKAVLLRRVR